MKLVECDSCAYIRFNYMLEKWECTRPGWRRYIDNPRKPMKCNFYRRRKEEETVKVLTLANVRAPNTGGSWA